jgi:hypothetical protein
VNLLTRTEEFDNAVWTARGFAKTGVTIGPDGGYAFAFTENNTDANPAILYGSDVTDGTPRTFGVWLKASAPISCALTTQSNTRTATVNITTEWAFYEVTDSVNAVLGPHIGGFTSITRGSGVVISVAMPQQEVGSTASAYQKVTSTFDVTEAGQADNYYLFHGGSADPRWMQTPSIDFTGTDKMTVFAGVRKLSDAGQGVVTELSVSAVDSNGTFSVITSGLSSPVSSENYRSSLRGGSGGRAVYDVVPFAAPITNIMSVIHDISASGGSETTFRVNGSARSLNVVSNLSDAGTGNFGNYPLYLGARGGTSLFFDGHIHSLIVRGAQTDTPTIERTEKYVASKTAGIFNSTQVTWNSSTDTYTQSETTLGTR